MNNSIRKIKPSDAKQTLAIYKPYIENSAITFETEVPSVDEFAQRIEKVSSFYPWLVYDKNDKILGYSYATSHRQREAYKWSVDVAIYVLADVQGNDFGKLLYSKLLELLKKQGFYNAYAGIALPNEKSIGIHEIMGFKKIGEYNKVGYKLGKWWNVGWWELELNKKTNNPVTPRSIGEVADS